MKGIKRLVSYIICLVLVFTGFIHNKIDLDAADMTEETFQQMMDAQQEAVRAHEVLMESYFVSGNIVYPDEFAGTYIEDNILHIVLNTVEEPVLQKYSNLLAAYPCVEYELADYSYNFLYDETKTAAESVLGQFPVTGFYVDMKDNCGYVEIAENKQEAAENSYKRMRRSVGEYIKFKSGEYVEPQTTTLGGGVPVNNGTIGLTLGFGGYYGGKNAFITCGHDLNVGQSIYWNGTKIGTVVRKQFATQQSGDYSVIEAASGVQGSNYVNYTAMTGVVMFPAVGTYVYKHGAVGGTAYCQVNMVNSSTYETKHNVWLLGMTKAGVISGSSLEGDSGAPIRTGNSFCGIHQGYEAKDGYVVFTPYSLIRSSGFQSVVG